MVSELLVQQQQNHIFNACNCSSSCVTKKYESAISPLQVSMNAHEIAQRVILTCSRILVFSRDICFDSLDSASADAEGRPCFQMPGQDPGERGGKADVEAAQVEKKHQLVTSIWLGMGVMMMYIETENLEATSSFFSNTTSFPYK